MARLLYPDKVAFPPAEQRKTPAADQQARRFNLREADCMHIGSYDDEPATVQIMHEYMEAQGYELDITDQRLHHEIYLSDARKVAPEKLKTVIRHPIKLRGE